MSSNNRFTKLFQSLTLARRSETPRVGADESTTWVRLDGLNIKLKTFPAVRHVGDSFDEQFSLYLTTKGPTRLHPKLKLEVICLAVPPEVAGMFALDLRKLLETRAITDELSTSNVTRAIYSAAENNVLNLTLSKRRRRYELRPVTSPCKTVEASAAAFESLRRESRILFEYSLEKELLSGQNTLTHWGQVVKLYEGRSPGFLLKNAGGYSRYRYANVTSVALEEPGGAAPEVTRVEYDSSDQAKPLIRLSAYHSRQDQA